MSVHQWIRSAIRDSQQATSDYRFPIFETASTALCGTTGIVYIYILCVCVCMCIYIYVCVCAYVIIYQIVYNSNVWF